MPSALAYLGYGLLVVHIARVLAFVIVKGECIMSLFQLVENLPIIVLVIVPSALLVVFHIYGHSTLASRDFGYKIMNNSNFHLELCPAAVVATRSIGPENDKLHRWSNLPVHRQNENHHRDLSGIEQDGNIENERSDFFYLGVFVSFFGLAWGLVGLGQFLLEG